MPIFIDLSQTCLKSSPCRPAIERTLKAALDAVDPYQAVSNAVQRTGDQLSIDGHKISLGDYQRIWILGAGKASLGMAAALADALRGDLTGGAIITKVVPDVTPAPLAGRIEVLQGNHPVPGEDSLASTQRLLARFKDLTAADLVFCVISGGASALMTDPTAGIGLADLRTVTKALLACGASIHEMNTLRKHLDRVKGGGLVRLLAPARLVALVLSDVPGNDLGTIASGPTAPDASTYADARAILTRYHLTDQIPPSVLEALRMGERGELPETLKPEDSLAHNVTTVLVGSNEIAAQAALRQAEREGFRPYLLTNSLQGEASEAGRYLASFAQECLERCAPVGRPACVVAGGETTVTLKGTGLGGRNLELALAAVPGLAGLPGVALLTLATDGEDGPTDAAGAVVNSQTLQRSRDLGLDFHASLENNDSYRFFETSGDLIRPGSTGTNVNDLTFLFLLPEPNDDPTCR